MKKRGRRATPRDRDRARTEKDILAAVGRLLESSGFDDLGMNAVAREAGVDKVLVYRYFGKLPELLRAFAERGGHWPTDAELVGVERPSDPAELAIRLLVNFGRAIRGRPQTQAILRRELEERNPLTDALAEAREPTGSQRRAPAAKTSSSGSSFATTAAVSRGSSGKPTWCDPLIRCAARATLLAWASSSRTSSKSRRCAKRARSSP